MMMQVIDAEIARRRLLENTPIASRNEDPVNWDTSEIPTWAWVKRFHLPEVRAYEQHIVDGLCSFCSFALISRKGLCSSLHRQ